MHLQKCFSFLYGEFMMLSDIEIAQQAKIRPIQDIALENGLLADEVIPYGNTKAKVKLSVLERLQSKKDGYYINVTAITPTPLGEGKTTTAVGLVQGLGRLSKKTFLCLRQPSMGPTFGIKGGAAGGGYSQVIPMEDFNLHLTGDMHAITAAHNLIAAALDARLMHERNYSDEQWAKRNLPRLHIDPYRIQWKRILDVNDRALRHVLLGLGSENDGYPRESGFDISPASELMAILALATDLQDLRKRIGRTIVAFNTSDQPVTVEDLGVAGAATVILKEALQPNLMQTLEGQPTFVHAGPFANIAHGNNSIVADNIALKLADYVVTESGFGADMGMQKFFDIKCRYSGKYPNVVVLVATTRALKMHGGGPRVIAGRPLPEEYTKPNKELLEKGCCNLVQNIKIAKTFHVPVVVAINHFPTDTEEEYEVIKNVAQEAGAFGTAVSKHFAEGGEGALELAELVVQAVEQKTEQVRLYEDKQTIIEKITAIAQKIYGAKDIFLEEKARKQIKLWEKNNLASLPICMAKTQYSLSHDPSLKGAPTGFTLPVKEVCASAGAGFLYVLCGDISLMPGLPSEPAFLKVDIDSKGDIIGLF